MSDYWDGVKRRWRAMTGEHSPPPNTGSGGTGTGPGGVPGKEWELVYQKFREIMGRDPYSFQELKDWWSRT